MASGSGISGRVAKYSGNLLRHLAVNRLLGQRLLLEKLFEWLEGLIAVGGPQQQQLFQRGGPVRNAIGLPASHCLRRFVAAHDT